MIGKIHDENQDVRILNRKLRVNPYQKAIFASHLDVIGIRTWSRIDYLCHYCGYHLIWGESEIIDKNSYEDDDKKKNLRVVKKAAKVMNKINRTSNSK